MKRFAILASLAVALVLAAGPACTAGKPAAAAADTITTADLLQPADLVRVLKGATPPAVFQVGFPLQYHGAHIPGARYAGPGSKAAGLDSLAHVLAPLPRTRAIVLYCGCCPWEDCPNVHPAFTRAKSLGFRNVKVMYVGHNFQKDWVEHGYPVSKSDS